jgi:hypothetical protein
MIGHLRWVFPDGDLPPRGEGEPHGHESLVIFNPNQSPADIRLTIYFSDRAPVRDLTLCVEGERVCCVRMDEPVGDQGYLVPFGQYALVLDSTTPVVAQIGRMDVQQPNLAYYTVMGFPA